MTDGASLCMQPQSGIRPWQMSKFVHTMTKKEDFLWSHTGISTDASGDGSSATPDETVLWVDWMHVGEIT
jgi:hypothetical protein